MALLPKILIFPSLTTIERDALSPSPDGTSIYNETDSRIEYTINGGSSWDIVATIGDVTNISLQNAYDNGLGSIVTTAAKPVLIDTTLSGFQISGLTASSLVTSDVSNNLVSGNLSGDLTTTGLSATFATVNSNVGTFGDASNVAQVTVNAKGLVTAVSDVAIDLTGITLQDAYNNGDGSIITAAAKPVVFDTTLSGFQITGLSATSLVTSDASNNLVTANISGDISTAGLVSTLATVNANVGTFGDASHVSTVTLNAKGLVTAAIETLITPAAIGAPTTTGTGATGTWNIDITGNAATVTTNANLSGDVSSVGNVTTLATVAAGGTFGDSGNIPQITYNTKGLVTSITNVPIDFSSVDLQQAYTNGDGTITTTAAKPVVIDTTLAGFQISGLTATSLVTSDASNNLVTGNLSGDLTTSGLASTLATVNSNVGTFGDSTNVAQVTVNAKGLITAATDVAIDLSSVDFQAVYDNSLPTPKVIQNNSQDTQFRGPSDVSGFLFDTTLDNAIFAIEGDDAAIMGLDFFKSTLTDPGKNEIGRICWRSSVNGVFSDMRVSATDVTPGSESAILEWDVISSGVSIQYIEIDGAADTIKVPNSTTSTLDEIATISDITLQNAYDTGDGTITTAGAKPVVIDTTLAGFQISGLTATSLVTSDASNNLVTGNLSGDLSTAGLISTLATVNANIGTFGSASNVAQITVNAKGLITAATDVAITGTNETLQEVYDNSATPPKILQDNGKLIEINNAGDTAGFLFNTDSATAPTFQISSNAGGSIPAIDCFSNSIPGGSADIFDFRARSLNSSGSPISYGEISFGVEDDTASSESASLDIRCYSSGIPKEYIKVDGNANTIKVPNSTTSTLDEIATISDVTLQNAYDTGDGTITVTASKPIEIVGIDNTDPAAFHLYTPSNTGTVSFLDFDGNNSVAAQVGYGEIDCIISDNTAGAHSGRVEMRVSSAGSMDNYIAIDGQKATVTVTPEFNFTSPDVKFIGGPASVSYAPCITMLAVSEAAIQIGAPLTASTTTDFRVRQTTSGDAATIAVIGFAVTAAVGAGEEIEICGATLINVQSDSTGAITRADTIDKSNTDNGRVMMETGSTGQFGAAAQSVAANTFFKCWLVKNQNF